MICGAQMRIFKLLLPILASFLLTAAMAQPTWQIPNRDREILIDGFLEDWEGVPELIFSPGDRNRREAGEFSGSSDLTLKVQSLWDDEYLYLGVTWIDDLWDVKEVTRKDAVWVDSDGKRRDRMYFFDFLKFHIRKSDYDYTFWVSPRVNEEGPYFWNRLLEGYTGMERAAGSPMITAREHSDRVTLEIMLLWNQLKLEPKQGLNFPLTLVVSDSDHPGRALDHKLNYQKWIGWVGRLVLTK